MRFLMGGTLLACQVAARGTDGGGGGEEIAELANGEEGIAEYLQYQG